MSENPLHDLSEFEESLSGLHLTPPSKHYVRKAKSILKPKHAGIFSHWHSFLTTALASLLVISIGINFQQRQESQQATVTLTEPTPSLPTNTANQFPDTPQHANLVAAANVSREGEPRSAEHLYTVFCRECHENGLGGAPRTGFAEDWIPRVNKGLDALVKNSVFSFSGSLPCPDCTVEELAAVVEHMVPVTIPRFFGQSVQYLADAYLKSIDKPAETTSLEVTYLFWYGCHFCTDFDQQFNQWAQTLPANTTVNRLPAVWSPIMAAHARAYFTALEFDNAEAIHQSLFEALSSARDSYQDAQSFAPIFLQHGVDFDTFMEVYESHSVQQQVSQAQSVTKRLRKLGLTGIPGLIVNNEYLVKNSKTEDMLRTADYLLEIRSDENMLSSDLKLSTEKPATTTTQNKLPNNKLIF